MSGPVAEHDPSAFADRASASVGEAVTPTAGAGQRSTAPVRGPAPLLVRWFHRVITHPGGVAAGRAEAAPLEAELGARAVEDLVTSSQRLGAQDRLAIYSHAYHARLVECVREDYPALAQAMGRERFRPLARAYVAAHPSRTWDLVPYAARLPDFLRDRAHEVQWPDGMTAAAAADLARLEWALVEVQHEPAPRAVSMSALAAVPPERWGDIRLTPSRALRVLSFEHAVHEWYRAIVRDQPWPQPLAAPSALAVWRQGGERWRMKLTPTTAAVLSALIGGATLAEALAPVPDDSPDDVMRWFGSWVDDGLFAGVVPP